MGWRALATTLPAGALYQSLSGIMDAINGLTKAVTGDRQHLRLEPRGLRDEAGLNQVDLTHEPTEDHIVNHLGATHAVQSAPLGLNAREA
jgi:hypothetical protein